MIEVNLIVNDQEIELSEPVTIVSGSENVYLCKFTFTSEWTGFEKTAVFLSRTDAREVYVHNNECIIPWEALEIDDIRRQELKIGVYGVKNDVRMPTVYTKPLTVHPGAETAEGGGTPTPTQWEQILELLSDGTVYIDPTLTTPGKGADAAVTGRLLATKMYGAASLTAQTPTETKTGQYCSGNTPSFTTSSTYTTKKYAVLPNTLYTFIGCQPSATCLLARFYDSEGVYISSTIGTVDTGSGAKKAALITPQNASFVWLNTLSAQSDGGVYATTYNTDIDDFRESIEADYNAKILELTETKMDGQKVVDETLTATQVMSGKRYNTTDGLVDSANYSVSVFDVTPGDLMRVSGVMPSASNVLYAFFTSGDNRISYAPASLVKSGRVTAEVTVPTNASYMYVLGYPSAYGDGTADVLAIDTDPDAMLDRFRSEAEKPLKVTKTNKGIVVEDGLFSFTWRKIGANNLMNFYTASYNESVLFATQTDWIGPYNFLAVNNADGDKESLTTGGNHSIHNDDSSIVTPTARTLSWKVLVDGEEMTGDEARANEIGLYWVNRVQAGNTAKLAQDASGYGTGRECLEEHGHAIFKPGGMIEVGVDFTPLEDILMDWYSGLQFAGSSFAPNLFIPEYTTAPITTAEVDAAKNEKVVERVVARGPVASLEMFMDRRFGIARNYQTYYYDGNGDKGYFVLYSYQDDLVAMPANTWYSWRGHYRFTKTFPELENAFSPAAVTSDAKGINADAYTTHSEIEKALAIAYSAYVTETAQGNPASFSDGANNIPVEELIVDIDTIQEGSGTPSASNPRLFVPKTGVTITHNNKAPLVIPFGAEAGDVYGGTLNVTTGELTVTHAFVEFDGTENWGISWANTNPAFYLIVSTSVIADSSGGFRGLFSLFSGVNIWSGGGKGAEIETGSDTRIFVRYDDMPQTVDAWKQQLAAWKTAETPLQAVYKLATPQVYRISGNEIKTLLGDNSIICDTGDVSVTYRADTGLYIEKKIAEAAE